MSKQTELRDNKRVLRSFLQAHYTDARLTQLLDHARSGKLAFYSCCCFIGCATADHELRGEITPLSRHYDRASMLPGAKAAEDAYYWLAEQDNGKRRRILIPMLLAEIRRRQRLAMPATEPEAAKVGR